MPVRYLLPVLASRALRADADVLAMRAATRVVLLLARAHALETAASTVFSWLSSRGGGASVAVGTGSDGLRGLTATCAAKPGDVLLEVPLACCLSDFGAGEAAVEPPS